MCNYKTTPLMRVERDETLTVYKVVREGDPFLSEYDPGWRSMSYRGKRNYAEQYGTLLEYRLGERTHSPFEDTLGIGAYTSKEVAARHVAGTDVKCMIECTVPVGALYSLEVPAIRLGSEHNRYLGRIQVSSLVPTRRLNV